jgi:hypothetical protein
MKKLYTLLTAVILTASTFAQAPGKMSYQAIVRDAGNALITSQGVGMQLSILQGSVSGTAVYVETQTPTTNINGLVSIEIGSGAVVSGTFNTINWSNGPYFIKTETDPTGGSTYTITGTSQLMSVPYALHSNTADSIVGGISITETDPVFGASIANGITAADTANWNNHTVDTDTQLDSTDIANLGFVAGSGTSGYSIGDFAHGGIVFWVDETGQHGLVCAKSDQSAGVRWDAGTYTYTMALGDGPFSGELNTSIIIANQGYGDGATYAARICNELQITEGGKTYGDWYLPSKEELNLMYVNKTAIDVTALANSGTAFALDYYWSSTENGNLFAWGQNFLNGTQFGTVLKPDPDKLRAIREF